MDDVRQWLEAAPDSVKSYFCGSIIVLNFWRDERNRNFQAPGLYDGSISEDCKELCRNHEAIANEIVSAQDRWRVTHGASY